jgi:hypothetical protein
LGVEVAPVDARSSAEQSAQAAKPSRLAIG